MIASIKVPGTIRGAALSGNDLYTWGEGIQRWTLPALKPVKIRGGQFGEGGCVFGKTLVLQEGVGVGKLVQLDPYEVIDTGTDTHDCLEATLFGRRGVLAVHRYMQVRFYEQQANGKWTYREIYSFYTPSQQTGLLLADIDGDGRPDILCGNYWIQTPASFELPWRLFAINAYSEHQESAMMRLALRKPADELVVAQSHMPNGRVTVFEKPANPEKLWIGHRLGEFAYPHGLAVVNDEVLIGENNGPKSRILRNGTDVLGKGVDVIAMWPYGKGQLLTVGPHNVTIWAL